MIRRPMIYGQAKGEIEITIVKGSIPTHADLVTAHQLGQGLGVKRGMKQALITLFLLLPLEICLKSPQGYIVDGQETREDDSVATA